VKHLPSYARPVFVRIVDNLAMTETFKTKKQQLIDDGFNPSVVTDVMLTDDAKSGAYVALTADYYTRLFKPLAR
jgi:fatty-acyl-CoA synthase